jgi:hypothetical protein
LQLNSLVSSTREVAIVDCTIEKKNGDSPWSAASIPSPERIDAAFRGESPLEKSITDPAGLAIILE